MPCMLVFREFSQRRETIVLIRNVSHGWDGIQNCQVSGAFSGNYTRLWRQAVPQFLTETHALTGKPSACHAGLQESEEHLPGPALWSTSCFPERRPAKDQDVSCCSVVYSDLFIYLLA